MDAHNLQESLSQIQQMFLQRMDAYQGELKAAAPSANITNLTADFNTFRGFIMSALQCLQQQVGLLAHQADNTEMRSRRKILLLHGLPEETNEDTAAVVVKAVGGRMKVTDFSAKNISRCHRMGRISAPDRPRPILFKVREVELRNKIWYAKSGLKGSGVTVSEFLTKARHDAFMAARQRYGVSKCFTREGFIFVLTADGARHRISSLAELEAIAVPEAPKAVVAAKEPRAASKSRRAGGTAGKK